MLFIINLAKAELTIWRLQFPIAQLHINDTKIMLIKFGVFPKCNTESVGSNKTIQRFYHKNECTVTMENGQKG